MSVQNKPDYKIFADGAKPGEVVDFPDVLRGWGVTLDTTGGVPPMDFMNGIMKRLNEWLMYLTQRGIPEWDASVEYPKDAVTSLGGKYYYAIKESVGNNPPSSQSYWRPLEKALNVPVVQQATGQSIYDVMSQKAATDSFASSEFFRYLSNEYTVIYSPNKTYRIVVFNDGAFGSYLTDGGASIVSFDKNGKMTKGEIPTDKISGLKQILGSGVNTIPSEKAVSDALGEQKSDLETALYNQRPLGMGQLWRDVTFARSAGVSYQNNKNRSIEVNVRTERLVDSGVAGITLECDGIVISSNRVSGSGTQAFVSAVIPDKSNYKVTVEGSRIFQWSELTTQ